MEEELSTKQSLVIVYTGDGKGKTSAALGLMCRALGTRWRVAFIQFIKTWGVGEHTFIRDIQSMYSDDLYFYKGGKGFYDAGEMSASHVTPQQHKLAAGETYRTAFECATSGKFHLVICDEINNAVHDGLLTQTALQRLIDQKHPDTSLCLTGRNFPKKLLGKADIATDMKKLKHHYDDGFIANKGIDY